MFATPGKDAKTVKAFAEDLQAHNGDPKTKGEEVTCDMSPAFIKEIKEYLSEFSEHDGVKETTNQVMALEKVQPSESISLSSKEEDSELVTLHCPQITFDRYHVVAKANEAVDKVRKIESKIRPELKQSRYLWLKNESKLSAKQRETLTWLTRPSMHLKTTRAPLWRDDFNEFYQQSTPEAGEAYLCRWCYGAKRSFLEPIKEFVKMVEAHWDGIIAWQKSRLNNGLLEGTNSLIQSAKRRARGYRTTTKMITIIYLIAGKLPLSEIHTI